MEEKKKVTQKLSLTELGTSYLTREFMWELLGLSGTSLIIYSIIYSYSRDGRGAFHGKQEYLAKIVGKSRATVNLKLKELVLSGLIIECGSSEYRTKNYKANLAILKELEKSSPPENQTEQSKESGASVSIPTDICQKSLHNKKTDNKEIRQSATAHARTGERKEKCKMALQEAEEKCLFAYERLEECKGSGASSDIYDIYEKDYIKAREELSKYKYAYENADRLKFEDNFFDSFGYYGRQGLVLLSEAQHEYLLSWVGNDVLIGYYLKLERFISENPGVRIHSHFALLKKWISDDFALELRGS